MWLFSRRSTILLYCRAVSNVNERNRTKIYLARLYCPAEM
jgi:hypothetical protein